MAESLHDMAKRVCDGQNCKTCLFREKRDGFYTDALGCFIYKLAYQKDADELIQMLQDWAKEHPVKTYLDDIYEKYPMSKRMNIDFNCKGCVMSVFYGLSPTEGKCADRTCKECWNSPLGSFDPDKNKEE